MLRLVFCCTSWEAVITVFEQDTYACEQPGRDLHDAVCGLRLLVQPWSPFVAWYQYCRNPTLRIAKGGD
jgi:hypothetical protein